MTDAETTVSTEMPALRIPVDQTETGEAKTMPEVPQSVLGQGEDEIQAIKREPSQAEYDVLRSHVNTATDTLEVLLSLLAPDLSIGSALEARSDARQLIRRTLTALGCYAKKCE